MHTLLQAALILTACTKTPPEEVSVVENAVVAVGDCSQAKNVCPDYSTSWGQECPDGERCITLVNSCEKSVSIAYQIGCNGDGTKGAPQCDCTEGPLLTPGGKAFWIIVDGNYTSCLPSWQPACLTAGLALMVNEGVTPNCTQGSRVEFSAGNQADVYGKFDSYNLSRILGFSVPYAVSPDLECAQDSTNHDCRPLVCSDAECPDAYSTPTGGTCPDGRSPQSGCQDTFGDQKGYTVTFCPTPTPPSCQDATPC